MKKIFGILFALALVLNFSVVATSVSADDHYYAELVANITAPVNGVDIMGGAEFTVSANVTNNGTGYAQDVKATIEISGNATLKVVAGNVATKSVAPQLPAVNGTGQVSWVLVCTGAGAVNMTVTPSGKDPITLNPIFPGRLHSDTVSINQEQVLDVAYELTMAADPVAGGDAIDVGSKGAYAPGAAVRIKAVANTGYGFVSWTADPTVTFDDATAAETTFTMAGQAVTVTARFTLGEGSKTQEVTDGIVDARAEADTEVEVTGTATVTVARYQDNPGGPPPTGFNSLGKYIDVYVLDAGEVTALEIRLYHTDAEVKGFDEQSLRLFWRDGDDWVQCSDSGVNTASTNGYSGYMWAKIRNNTAPSLDDLQGTAFGGYGHPSSPEPGVVTETVTNGIVDAKAEADTEVAVTGTATVTVAPYEPSAWSGYGAAPVASPGQPDWKSLGKYTDVYVPDTREATKFVIKLYYADYEVAATNIREETLRLFWWNGTAWVQCSDSGVNTDSNYIWAIITEDTWPSLADLGGTPWGGYGHPTPKGICLIATAAYGSDTAKEIDILREFRDTLLLPNSLGAEFVSLYYEISPPAANFISQHEVLRTAVRVGFIDPIIAVLTWSHDLWP